MSSVVVEAYRSLLALVVSLIVLTLIALPWTRPGSPSRAVAFLSLAILGALLVLTMAALRRSFRRLAVAEDTY